MPTVTLCTTPFAQLGRLTARGRRMPDLPIVVLPHPMAGRPADSVVELINAAADEIRAALTVGRPS